jgi:hypothetical protein
VLHRRSSDGPRRTPMPPIGDLRMDPAIDRQFAQQLHSGKRCEVALADMTADAMRRRLERAARQLGYRLVWERPSPPGGLAFHGYRCS